MSEELFTFQNPRLTPGLEQASDKNSGLVSQDKTTQASLLLHRGLRDTSSLGSFYAFLQNRLQNRSREKRTQRQADLESQRQKGTHLTLFLISHPCP